MPEIISIMLNKTQQCKIVCVKSCGQFIEYKLGSERCARNCALYVELDTMHKLVNNMGILAANQVINKSLNTNKKKRTYKKY